MHRKFWLKIFKGRDHFGDLTDGRVTIKLVLNVQDESMWNVFIWIRTGCSDGLF